MEAVGLAVVGRGNGCLGWPRCSEMYSAPIEEFRLTERIPLSSDDQKRKQRTATTTQTQGDAADEVLTPEEEKVVRARHGLAEDGDHELEFGVGANDEAKAQMAALEDFLMGAFQERETGKRYLTSPDDEADSADDNEAKQQIVDALNDDD